MNGVMLTKEQAETLECDGWMIEHHRAYDSLQFGPFSTFQEALQWWEETGQPEGVNPGFVPLYKTVDWNR